jgi:hypothetical protein
MIFDIGSDVVRQSTVIAAIVSALCSILVTIISNYFFEKSKRSQFRRSNLDKKFDLLNSAIEENFEPVDFANKESAQEASVAAIKYMWETESQNYEKRHSTYKKISYLFPRKICSKLEARENEIGILYQQLYAFTMSMLCPGYEIREEHQADINEDNVAQKMVEYIEEVRNWGDAFDRAVREQLRRLVR